MKFSDFKKECDNGTFHEAYLALGSEVYFRDKCLSTLLSVIAAPEFDYTKLDGENITNDYATLYSALLAYPMLGEKRLVVVDDYYPSATEFEKNIGKYLESPLSSTILLIRNSKTCDSIDKCPNIKRIDLEKADRQSIIEFINEIARERGKKMMCGAADKIAAFSLDDMQRIVNELEKLFDYVGDKESVSVSDVEAVVTADSEYKIYEMTDALAKRNPDKALAIISDLLNKNENAGRLYVSIYNYFRKLFFVSISEKSDVELAKTFGTKEYAIKKTRQTAAQYKKKSLKLALETLAVGDYNFKSGGVSLMTAFYSGVFSILALESQV